MTQQTERGPVNATRRTASCRGVPAISGTMIELNPTGKVTGSEAEVLVKREDQPWRHDKFFDEVAQDDAASKAKAPGEHLRDNEPVPPLTHAEKAEASQEDSQNQSDTGDRSGGNESPTRDSLLDEVV